MIMIPERKKISFSFVMATLFIGTQGQTAIEQGCSTEIGLCVVRMQKYEKQFKGYLPYFNSTETWKQACRIVQEVDDCVRASFPLCTTAERIVWGTVTEAYDHICQGDENTSEFLRYRGCYGLPKAVNVQNSCNNSYTANYIDATNAFNSGQVGAIEYSKTVCQTFNELFTCVRDGLIDACGEPAAQWIHNHFSIVFAKLLAQIQCEMVPFHEQPLVVAECQLYQVLECQKPVSELSKELNIDPDTLPVFDRNTALRFCRAHLETKRCIGNLGDCGGYEPLYKERHNARDFMCNDIEKHQEQVICLRSPALDIHGKDKDCKKLAADGYTKHEQTLTNSGDIAGFNRDSCQTLQEYFKCIMTPVYNGCGCEEAAWIGVYKVLISKNELTEIKCQIDLAAAIPNCPAPTLPSLMDVEYTVPPPIADNGATTNTFSVVILTSILLGTLF